MNYTDLELFAGGGGLALGLNQAGFKSVGMIENNHDACCTLKRNFADVPVIEHDITNLNSESKEIQFLLPYYRKLDLISGGYPCQSFSYAGKQLGFADTRGTLFYNYAYFLKLIQPKMFVAENVPGLRTNDHGRTFKTMLNVFSECNYRVQWQILNANDYGVAEKRRRLIMIGMRSDFNLSYKFPVKHNYKPVLKDVLQNVPDSPGASYSKSRYNILKQVPAGGWWKDLPTDVAKEYMGNDYSNGGGSTGVARRLSWNEPCLTIMTAPIGKRTERCHPDETRPLTIREEARIQGFPDDYLFSGFKSSQYKQIGNAVPVPLAKEIGKSIISALNSDK